MHTTVRRKLPPLFKEKYQVLQYTYVFKKLLEYIILFFYNVYGIWPLLRAFSICHVDSQCCQLHKQSRARMFVFLHTIWTMFAMLLFMAFIAPWQIDLRGLTPYILIMALFNLFLVATVLTRFQHMWKISYIIYRLHK